MRGVDEGGKGGVLLCVELEGRRASWIRSAHIFDDRALHFLAKFQTAIGPQVHGMQRRGDGVLEVDHRFVQRTNVKVSRQP